MEYLLTTCQLILATVMLAAATGKIIQIKPFEEALRQSHIPVKLIVPTMFLVPTIEIGVTLGLLLSTARILPFLLLLCATLLIIFTLWMFTIYFQGLQLECGCFGTGGSKVGRGTILRNIILILISVGGFFLSLHTQIIIPPPSIWMVITVSSCCLIFMLFLAFWQGRKELVLFPK